MSQDEAVDSDESILRRISRHADHYNPSLDLPITPFAFRPRDDDTDGISLFRERMVSTTTLRDSGRNPPYVIARLKASDVFALGLSLAPTPSEEGIPGHVVIPELSSIAYRNNKPFVKETFVKLARLASNDVIANFA